MELTQLKYYVRVAETLSFTHAAKVLHLSQPALSYQMKQLEAELGTRLFDRGHRQITLTPDGELFLPLAQAVLMRADEAVRILKEHLGAEGGEVHMGSNPSLGAFAIPDMLAAFRESFPRVRVHLVEGDDFELENLVVSGTIDFALVTAPGTPQALEVIPLCTEDLLLVVPEAHRLANRSSIYLEELATESFVFLANSFNVTVQFADACRGVGFEPRVAYRTRSVESVRGFVRRGLGISILPRMAAHSSMLDGISVIPFEGGLTRSLNLVRAKGRSFTRASRALMFHVETTLTNSPETGRPHVLAMRDEVRLQVNAARRSAG